MSFLVLFNPIQADIRIAASVHTWFFTRRNDWEKERGKGLIYSRAESTNDSNQVSSPRKQLKLETCLNHLTQRLKMRRCDHWHSVWPSQSLLFDRYLDWDKRWADYTSLKFWQASILAIQTRKKNFVFTWNNRRCSVTGLMPHGTSNDKRPFVFLKSKVWASIKSIWFSFTWCGHLMILDAWWVIRFAGREEIEEMEEGSTEIGKRNGVCSRPEKTSVDRPVDRRRDRSTGLSTGVHNMHKVSPIDRGIERLTGRSTDWKQAALCWVQSTGRSTDRRVLAFLSIFGFLFCLESNSIGVS